MERMEEDGEVEAISSSIKVIRFFVVEVKLGSSIGSLIYGTSMSRIEGFLVKQCPFGQVINNLI